MDAPVTIEEQRDLLRWARQSIEAALHHSDEPVIRATPGLSAPHAAFVTLTKQGELRGCIGRLDYERPLWRNTLDAAVAAALEDPRFPPVTEEELPGLELEISVLDPPVAIPDISGFDPQRHGIILEKGFRSALLLPQVAREHGWDAVKTLETVCWKAGLPLDAWRDPDARLQVFDAFVFGYPSNA